MALSSTCPKCGSISFEVATVEPNKSNHKLNFVRCSSCGGVVGVLDFYNIGSLLQNLAKELGFGSIH